MADISFVIAAVDKFSDTFNQLETGIKGVESQITAVGKGMAAAGAVITGVGALGVKSFMDFDSVMTEVQLLTGSTANEMGDLHAEVKRVAGSTPFTPSQIADGTKFMAMAGLTREEIEALTGTVANGAVAMSADFSAVSDIVTNAMSGMGADIGEAEHYVDVFAKTAASANTDILGLGEALKYVAPVANGAGMSIEQTSAMIGILGDAGIQGSQAGTSLRSAIMSIQNPSAKAAKWLENLGISVYDSDGNMRDMLDVLGDFDSALVGLNDEDKAKFLEDLFGKEASSAMMAMFEAGIDGVSEFTSELENATGFADEFAEVMGNTLKGQLESLKSTIAILALEIGEVLAPYVSAAVGYAQSFLDVIQNMNPQVKNAVIIFGALAGLFMTVGGAILMALPLVGKFIAGFKAVAAVLKITAGALAAKIAIIAAVVVAIAALVAGLIYAYNNVEWFRDMVDTAWAKIKEVFGTALEWIKGIVTEVIGAVSAFIGEKLAEIQSWWSEHGTGIMEAVSIAWEFIQGIIQRVMPVIQAIIKGGFAVIKSIVQGVWSGIKNIISGAMNVIKGVIEVVTSAIRGDWSGVWNGIKKILSGVVQTIVGIIQVSIAGRVVRIIRTALTAVRTTFTTIFNAVRNVTTTAFNAIRNVVNTVMNFFRSIVNSVMSFVRSFISSSVNTARSVVTSAFNGMRNIVRTVMNSIRSVISSGWNSAVSFLRSINLVSIGKNIIQGLINGIRSMFSGVTSAIKGVAERVTGGITGLLGIKSPSRVMRDFGEWTSIGLANGIENMQRQVAKASEGIAMTAQIGMTPEAPTFDRLSTSRKPYVIYENGSPAGAGDERPIIIENVMQVDGREVARSSAKYTKEEIEKLEKASNRARGLR